MKKEKTISGKLLHAWILVCERRKRTFYSQQIKKELNHIFPGEKTETVLYSYYLKKVQIAVKILLAGGSVLLLCICKNCINDDWKTEGYLERKDAGGGVKTVVLDAEIGEVTIKDIVVELNEVKLSDDETEQQLQEIAQALPDKIAGNNESLEEVRWPLNLISAWEEEPVSIYWSSSDYGILKEDGSFGEDEVPVEGKEVILTASIIRDEMQKKVVIPVVVFPQVKTKEEKLEESLTELLAQKQEETKTDKIFVLPKELEDSTILWKMQSDSTIGIVLGMILLTIVAMFWGKDRELHQQYEKRNQELLFQYSEFVSKLQLLISSGMSIRSAFFQLTKEYQIKKKRGGERKYVYEELLVVTRKMENGMGETEAYEYFALCCDLICYKRLTAILLQNVKKGTEGLKGALLAEVKNAFEERKQTARKMGEEAGTKLLFPMMLMMGIVLVIIVVPAYFSFGGI